MDNVFGLWDYDYYPQTNKKEKGIKTLPNYSLDNILELRHRIVHLPSSLYA